MLLFFGNPTQKVFAVQVEKALPAADIQKLTWLFDGQPQLESAIVTGPFIGPRAAMVTPWSTNAVEITQNMAIAGIVRIEEFEAAGDGGFDPMLSQKFAQLDQSIFTINIQPSPILDIEDIAAFNQQEGLALSEEEIQYLEGVAQKIGRQLTDSEVFGFSQVNSEHCRHKIFNGTFVIDGEEKETSLFKLIKKTSQTHPNGIVSAYKDNVAFVKGPQLTQFSPKSADKPDFYEKKSFESVLSLKAETHNFPTTVEPFNGAATGSGGEIRDRLAGGKGSLPLAGTAVYMTAYSRLQKDRPWEAGMAERKWLYQTPLDILIKASNGASDFGNKFGQPLIAGSLLTFEHEEGGRKLGFDKVIMQAGGIGYGKADQALKGEPKAGDKIVVMGGDNYRIGMGGAAVSSADTGEFSTGITLNAVQRSNPEMQKRVANAVRGVVESDENIIVSIHDHGAGGHLNCLSELVEATGGKIDLDKLPIGDPTLSAKEIIGNESQERMGLVVSQKNIETLRKIAERERAPMYEVGDVTGDMRFTFQSSSKGDKPMDVALEDMFGSSPKTVLTDQNLNIKYAAVSYDASQIPAYIEAVLRLEAVACKDWLTNKVDRCVGGLVAKQQCAGPLQLPLNNCGVMALDYDGKSGHATSIGHAPLSGLIDPVAGSRNAIAEALTNLVWAPLEKGLRSVSLSANWMWPCKNEGEDARLYEAVEAVSEFAIALGINIPTGKDSLSMKQKYPDGCEVISPGTVIISAAGHCDDRTAVVEPVLQKNGGEIYYLDLSKDGYQLGGSSFAQAQNRIGESAPSVTDAAYFAKAFDALQNLIKSGLVHAGHDVSAGGLLTCLLEMCFADVDLGAEIDLTNLGETDSVKLLFAENSGVVFQCTAEPQFGRNHAAELGFGSTQVETLLNEAGISFHKIGVVTSTPVLAVANGAENLTFSIPEMRDVWYETSYLLDRHQSGATKAKERFNNYKKQPLQYIFPENFTGKRPVPDLSKPRPKAAVLREKGSNSEREMAHAMYLAGFDVKDVHMTDLISGRETLEDIQFLGAVGGFSNSDVLGSAKGWAGACLYNEKAKRALDNFFKRDDVLSVGICNGCQLFVELNLINPEHATPPKMLHNESHKHESVFTSVVIPENNSVMLSSLAGCRLGIWVSHGEGKFHLPLSEDKYNIVAKYGYAAYPANPNGSDYNAAMLASADGRHLATMPHFERSMFKWNWANYPTDRQDDISPWVEAFLNARRWFDKND
ncbi:MAG: phosphoribosylformylglycinamidine synthase [Saprospiraceae bacterium]|nr:phosphoribosylformylglycinamidine synthase [Saprospiraceae bacterium]MCF8248421.1 phosphoribosylformylglycinamidine synthase [Saprospiraceae bacterium]MCF8280092.1 phosphoribosylformylglycinamidine synthase [Bacteroidales bacterium]MCF8309949.1 phosphoribosylformylglycinamidine synthase [Saprospiraceae bacterium]MCF8438720.1 phosphoribosylformylglycinamidine synthase [Saprospiraceae bacterium]